MNLLNSCWPRLRCLCFCFCAGASLASAVADAAEQFGPPLDTPVAIDAFTRSGLSTQNIRAQTGLHADLAGSGQDDLLLLQIQSNKERRLSLYRATAERYSNEPLVVRDLPADVIFADIGSWQGRDVLVLFSATQAYQFDPVTGQRQTLVRFTSIYNNIVDKALPRFNMMRDLNDDGLDDFLVPGFAGFSLFIQQPGGKFTAAVSMAAPPVMEMSYNEHPWYQARKTYHTDVNADGRDDLTFWVDDEFKAYLQQDDGFSAESMVFTPAVVFEAEGYEGISMRMGGEDQSNVLKKALFQFNDLDGDSRPELVTLAVKSEGVLNKQTTYEFYRGQPSKDGVPQFSATPDSRIESKGVQFDMQEKDLNGDGQLDIIVSSVELGLGKLVRALLTGAIRIDLGFYQMQNGTYPELPNIVRTIKATFSFSSGDVFVPTVLIADVTGDGLADLLLQEGDDQLHIYVGEATDQLFADNPIEVFVAMPRDPDLVQLADLNHDGKQDLILEIEVKGKPDQILILIKE
ncbi:MAG: hypothetical protein ACI9PN_002662 [Candidatus Azotimanducaceae bacterium]|jgi:hypothetical protein